MRAFRPLPALSLVVAALALSGCATSWNDRYASNWESVRRLFGGESEAVRDWPTRDVPTLPPLTTDTIPDRRPSKGDPTPGWPPLAPALDGELGDSAGSGCTVGCDTSGVSPAHPDPAVRSDAPPAR